MSGQNERSRQPARRFGAPLRWTCYLGVIVALMIVVGVGLVALLGVAGNDDAWERWSDIGQAFGVLGSVASSLALVALVVSFVAQSRDLRTQRAQSGRQSELLQRAEHELRRNAEAQLRALHVGLLRFAMDDEDLAAVWPPFAGVDEKRNRQFMYANLILQHAWLQWRLDLYKESELISHLRYLFASPVMREYWKATSASRNSIYVPGTNEFFLAEAADDICREYEAVLACAADDEGAGARRTQAPTPRHRDA